MFTHNNTRLLKASPGLFQKKTKSETRLRLTGSNLYIRRENKVNKTTTKKSNTNTIATKIFTTVTKKQLNYLIIGQNNLKKKKKVEVK